MDTALASGLAALGLDPALVRNPTILDDFHQTRISRHEAIRRLAVKHPHYETPQQKQKRQPEPATNPLRLVVPRDAKVLRAK